MATDRPPTPMERWTGLWNSLSRSARVAIALVVVAVVAAMAFGLSALPGSGPSSMAPLLGGHDFSLEERESAIKAFQERKLSDYTLIGSKIFVPKAKEADYLSALATGAGGLPGDTDRAIDKYIEEQRSWWASTAESERLFRVAEQRRLARVIESFPEIDHASVLASEPPERGTLRGRTPKGTAAVKISTVDGKPLHPQRVEQIRELVDGAFRDIPGPEHVKVVEDALRTTGGQGSEHCPDPSLLSQGAGQYLMTKAAFECQVENKVRELFADLKGLVVKVNAELDPRHRRSQNIDMKEKGPIRSESGESSNSEAANIASSPAGGEPGVRPNVDIPGQTPNQGAIATVAAPNVQNDEVFERTYDNIKTLTEQSFVDFEPVKVGIVVRYRVPPGAPAEAEGAPTPLAIREMIASLGYPGMTVETVAVQPYVGEDPPAVEEPTASVFDRAVTVLPAAGLTMLGLLAVILAIVLARRAPLPQWTVAQESSDPSQPGRMPELGVELPRDEAAVKFEQLQSQINKMVQANPEAAAGFVKRWILETEA